MVDILQTKTSIIKSQTTETVSNENEINHSQHCKMSFKRYFYVQFYSIVQFLNGLFFM